MNIEGICYNLQSEKEVKDTIGSNYLSNNDYNVCNYIINKLPNINFTLYKGKPIFKSYAIKSSLKQFKIFNKENYQSLLHIIKKTKIQKDYPLHACAVTSTFNINLDEKKILTPGYVSAYHLPPKIHDIDIISLGHEHCHALKETNYLEAKNYLAIGEVIPIFYELINYENIFLKEKHLEYRLFYLQEMKNIYLSLSEILKGNINNHKLSFLNDNIDETLNTYEFAKSYFGSYLGSFYYAIILYNLYKKDPIKILTLVNDVLSHKITTIDMLNKLNLYCNVLGKTFEKEIKNMKKVLSK